VGAAAAAPLGLCRTRHHPPATQAALGLGGSADGSLHGASANGGTIGTIPAGCPTNADMGCGRKRLAVAADNQEATDITSYAKPDFVKQLICECWWFSLFRAACLVRKRAG
jgi:hypothetical protein